ncbi:hypothetical protein, partial [Enterobacter hormaechei]|uniref:hypothetical protein n=1 Tax=Enterobacter hormaechei TaxID=158836 RepID=UPI0013D1B4B7
MVSVRIDLVAKREILACRPAQSIEVRAFATRKLNGSDVNAPVPDATVDVPVVNQPDALALIDPKNFAVGVER